MPAARTDIQSRNLKLAEAAEAIVTERRGPKPAAIPLSADFRVCYTQRDADRMLASFARLDEQADRRREFKDVFAKLRAGELGLAPVQQISPTKVCG